MGILVEGGADPVVVACKIWDATIGIVFCDVGTKGCLDGCELWGNTHAGVHISLGADPLLTRCK